MRSFRIFETPRTLEFTHDTLDSAVQKLLIPTATSIINGLRTKKDAA
jgi:hypothetical protein